ncbi:TetR/AcrR family transcriptional regulator [Curtobacterium sp. MCLR17_007]|uniref:TetR/AcrR family transcriptional regulator n=1 Tax=Curtobacterium sp. MCLR17_007 TaxID=2175648 RepID=UPI000DA7AA02|nr:TetR/AcrR family transcriptional regulator [Curtobacterium sp. MCLR17_007]WIB59272.1 TetR/AcrR family transcriptional regulator [Curtobacterium sp. MCLR17_007]
MPRKPDPTLKPAIVEKVAQHLRDTPTADVSVRSLGRVLGTSAYPIVYHFGSRDALIDAVVDHLAPAADQPLDPATDATGLADWLVARFGGLDDPDRALAARLTFELGAVESLAGRTHEHRSHQALVDAVSAWCTAHGHTADTAATTARAVVSGARGAQWSHIVDDGHTDVDTRLRAVARGLTSDARVPAG